MSYNSQNIKCTEKREKTTENSKKEDQSTCTDRLVRITAIFSHGDYESQKEWDGYSTSYKRFQIPAETTTAGKTLSQN